MLGEVQVNPNQQQSMIKELEKNGGQLAEWQTAGLVICAFGSYAWNLVTRLNLPYTAFFGTFTMPSQGQGRQEILPSASATRLMTIFLAVPTILCP